MKNKDKTLNQSNFLSSTLVAGSAIGAAKYFYSRFGKEHLRPSKKSTFVSPKLSFSSSAEASPAQFITHLTKTLEGASLAKTAWKRAVESIDPNSAQTLTFAGNIDELEGDAVGSAIEHTINHNQSLYMGQIFSRFKQNVGILSKQYAKTGSIPAFGLENLPVPPGGVSLASNQIPGRYRKSISKIKKTLGTNFAEVTYHTREGWEQEGFGLYDFRFNYKGKSFNISVPSVSNGVLVEGRTQSSKRIAPKVTIFDPRTKTITSTMERDEYLLESFNREILPNIVSGKYKSSREIQREIDALYGSQIHSLQNVANVPANIKHEGLSRYIGIRSQAVDIRVAGKDGYRLPNDKELTEALKTTGLIPSTSGKAMAKEARFSTSNPAEWSLTPGAVDFSRSPGQANREWMATPEAVQAMMDKGRIKFNKLFDTPERIRDLGTNPALRTLYIDPSRHRKLLENLRLDEGESLMSSNPELVKMMQVSRLAPAVHLDPKHTRSDLAEIIAGNKAIQPGEIIGWTTEGHPFTYKAGMNLKGMIPHESTGRGNYLDLAYEEVVNMPEHSKKFADVKAVERFADERDMAQKIAKKTRNKLFISNIERVATMDELRKDKSKHNKQMITAMVERMSGKKTLGRKGQIFTENPRVYARMLEKRIGNLHTEQGHKEFIKGLMRLGLTEGNLNPEEFGEVFGAVPSMVGKKGVRDIYGELAMNEFSFRHLREMYKGFAGGMSQTVYNASDAGGFGSMEPRAFELLQAGQYGDLGNDIAKDLMGRSMISNPKTISTHEALTKTLSSLAGKKGAKGNVWDLASKEYDPSQFQQFIEGGGGYLRPGKGLNDIYIPGATEAPGMGQFKTGAGKSVKGDLAGMYHDVARDLGGMYHDVDALSIDDAKKKLSEFTAAVHAEQAPSGRGAGSLLRGKNILGSRRLTIVSEARGQYTTNPFDVGLSEKYAGDMFDDLADRGIYDPAELKAMRERFFSGHAVGGGVLRDPIIGQYSFQPVNFRILRGVEDAVMTIPSNSINFKVGGENIPINISPLIGLGADKDADTAAAFFLSPSVSKRIGKEFVNKDNEFTQRMMQHNVRMQILKAKAKSQVTELTSEEKMIADAMKLETGQKWIGKISNQLSVARQAVASNAKGQASADSLGLLEWMEQTLISSKHMDASRVYKGQMADLFLQVQSSIKEKNAKRFQYAAEEMLKFADPSAQAALREGFHIQDGSQALSQLTGVNVGNYIPGINIESTSENIMSSLSTIEEAGMSKISKQLAGKVKLGMGEISKYLPFSSQIAESGAFSSLAAHAMGNKNSLLSMGMDVIKNNKGKIGFGFLGALAIGAALSTPEDTIGPSGGIQASPRVTRTGKGTGRVNVEPMASDQQTLGAPTAPNMLRSRRGMIQPGGNSARMSVRATTADNTNINRIVSNIRSSNRNSNINVNIRDSSSILNVHSIANKVLG